MQRVKKYEEKAHEEKTRVNTVSIKAKKSKPEPIPANHLFPVKRRKKTKKKN